MSLPAARDECQSPAREGEPSSGLAVVLGLALGPAVSIGLARFAYALLLPSMRTDLHWSFAAAGAMNTANAIGYLLGALMSAPLARRFGSRRAFLVGLAVTTLSLLGTAATDNVILLAGLRLLAGISGAITFVTGAGLVAGLGRHSSPQRGALLLGIYFAGGGVGILVSGLAIPSLLAMTSAHSGWRLGWVVLAILAALALAVSIPAALASREPALAPPGNRRWPARRLSALLASYTLCGVGYIAYMTFIVAFLKDGGAGESEVRIFWIVLGAAAIGGGFIWAPLIGSLSGGRGTAAIISILTLGAILPLLSSSFVAAIASAVLFGGSFLAVVTAVTTVARHSLRPHHWTPAIAGLTIVFAVGQCLGPILAGVVSDGPAGLSLGLGLSAGVLAIAALIALAQRSIDPETSSAGAETLLAP